MAGDDPQTVVIDGRRLKLTNLDKVLYPQTGTTKGEVIGYYHAIGALMVPHLMDRPVTRKRWPNGVGTDEKTLPPFFEKNLNPTNTPDWVPRYPIAHSDRTNDYPIVDDLVTLVWLAQLASLEIHVPQWRFDTGRAGKKGKPRNPDRLVLDLDPGPGVGLPECAQVAHWARELMAGIDLELVPVTSGSKGIHLYAKLDGRYSSDDASMIAKELATSLQTAHRDLVVSEMSKAQRKGKVFIDWSQNNGNKTTIAPYSMRGRARPTVAAPRSWDELDEDLTQLDFTELLARVEKLGDLFAPLVPDGVDAGIATGTDQSPDRLQKYRSMRDPKKTPEPVPAEPPVDGGGQSFVIQEHHARRLHYDFRLEHDGVLVSWAVPKGVPTEKKTNHLAVQTEDHPLEYGAFEGSIPHGEYGGGEVFIFDAGSYELEKWRDGKEVIVTLNGTKDGGVGTGCKVALIHTGGKGNQPEKNWLMHLMEGAPSVPDPVDVSPGSTDPRRHVADEATWSPEQGRIPLDAATGSVPSTGSGSGVSGSGEVEFPDEVAPMLATATTVEKFGSSDGWAFEMKWDGVRAVCYLAGGRVKLLSRRGNDATVTYTEIAQALAAIEVETAILDAEVVAMNGDGRPSFGRLQQRMGLTRPADVAAARKHTPVQLVVFDLLELNGRSLLRDSYDERRAALDDLLGDGAGTRIQVPPTFDGDLAGAETASRSLGLEGVVAKRRTSVYQAGSRGHTWLKIKNFDSQEVVIGGWKPGQGRRDGGVGSLLLGIPGPDGLEYVGKVGTGWTDAMLAEIETRLAPLARKTSPFVDVPRIDAKDAHWVTPKYVGEVRYGEFTDDHRLRHPSWRGWRDDKSPDDVRLEAT